MPSNRFNYLEFEQPEDDDSSSDTPQQEPFGPAHLPDAAQNGGVDGTEHPDFGHREYSVESQIASDPFIAAQRERDLGDETSGRGISTYHAPTHEHREKEGIEIKAVEFFGTRGSAAGEFNFPTGLAVDRAGILFVADVYNHRVQRITPEGGVAVVGSRGSGRTQFLAPTDVAVDIDRSFYVVEQGNNRVQKFSAEGILDMVFGRRGERAGEFNSPMGICISPATGEILVADTGNGRVQRFTMGGQYIASLGAAGSLQPPLTNPQAVTCDHFGNIYVADTLANRIARYDPLGRFTGHFGGMLTRGMNATAAPNVRFTEPHGVACGPNGHLFVADGNHGPGRLVVMTADTGIVKATISDPGKHLGPLARPGGVTIAPRLRTGFPDGLPRADLYLADTMNHRIIRFTCT